MSNTATQKSSKSSTRRAYTNRTSGSEVKEFNVSEIKEAEPSVQKITPKEVDSSQYVIVRNGFQGTLVYKSRKTGEVYIWQNFGDEQEMELRELRNAKNSYKKFFINNWFMFDEDWIIDYLGVRQYYKHAVPIDGFDDLFTQEPSKLKQTLSELSNGQKKSIAYRAMELIAENRIDSLSVISTLEDALGIDLIEK